MHAQQSTDPLTFHGEGPAYSPRWQGPRWVDMLAGDILERRPDGSVGRFTAGTVAAVIRPRRDGGHVIADARRILLADADDLDAPLTPGPELWTDENVRMNEGACDPAGVFYAGSTSYDHQRGIAALWRFEPDGSASVELDDITVSNGLEWSPDSSLAYYIDSQTRRVDVFDWDAEGGLRNRRPFVRFGPDDGDPDGLTVDADGGVWVSMFGAGRVLRFSSVGVLDGRVELPVSRVTAAAFVGPDLDELVITTSRKGLALPVEAEAGALFSVRPGVAGQPLREYAG
jgi:sugar lactone lactonase YvrE